MQRIEPGRQHWHIFYNPAAGGGRAARYWPRVYPQLCELLPAHTVHQSEERRHLSALVDTAVREQGARYLLAVGGDGAMHEMVNGIFGQTAIDPASVVVALLPLGTGNDWSKSQQLPLKITEWLQVFAAGQLRQQDVGRVTYQCAADTRTTYFVNAAGMAFDGYVVRYANRVRWRWMGNRFFYLWAILRCLFVYRLPKAEVHWPEGHLSKTVYTVTCGIGQYSGGGMQITPHANATDGRLAVTLAGRLTPLAVLLNTYRFYNGSIGDHPRVSSWHTTELRVTSAETGRELLLEADGEYLGHTPVHMQLLPRALTFVG